MSRDENSLRVRISYREIKRHRRFQLSQHDLGTTSLVSNPVNNPVSCTARTGTPSSSRSSSADLGKSPMHPDSKRSGHVQSGCHPLGECDSPGSSPKNPPPEFTPQQGTPSPLSDPARAIINAEPVATLSPSPAGHLIRI